MNAPESMQRDFVKLQRTTLVLLILNAVALGGTIIVWGIVAYQIHSQSIIP